WAADTAPEDIMSDSMGNHRDDLDILLRAQPGPDDIVEPASGQAAGIGADAVHGLDRSLRQFAEAVVHANDSRRRQRCLALAAEAALKGVARLGDQRDTLPAIPPRAGAREMIAGMAVRRGEIGADLKRRGFVRRRVQGAFLALAAG